ncbi:uncharacterized protein LOC141608084 [Silene latifolia]|uniref:uncharacterized protein LOC141608084 n=1 Tax=Silene latifolia TaxID=37657 RepID=UPI003D770EAC
MNLLSLNCRGLGNPAAVSGLRNLLRKEAPALVFLSETKLSGEEFRRVRASFDEYEGMEVDSVGRSGGLAFMWKKHVRCTFRSASVHHMDFEIMGDDGSWRATGFYGWPSVSERHLSWELLRLLGTQYNGPWVCIGDFNEVLFATEMKGGVRPQRQMNNFREAVDDCGLRDVDFEGYLFTYDNGQADDDNRQSRIDRALCNEVWIDLFPRAKLTHLEREWSDHAPILLRMVRRNREEQTVNKIFRFEHMWVGADGCEGVVQEAWDSGGTDLVDLLARCAEDLQKWKGVSIGKVMRDLKKKRRRLEVLNAGGGGGGRSRRAVMERKALVKEIAELLKQEELFWRQRSRAIWLKEGDRNTKFFHRKATQRKEKNHIAKLVDNEGRVWEGRDNVSKVAREYFEDVFASGQPNGFEHLLDGVEGRVTERMNMLLRCDYTEEEVVTALNQMHPLKAPGPDGMNGLFYQTYWHIVGQAVTRTVIGILRGAPFPEGINKTHIVLIPKKKAPDKMTDFRPISLCNVIYKLVSKVLANRLKTFLGEIVSENQSAFTPGRLITDNILVAFEMFHYMKNSKHKNGYMALKLDMSKAYDRVEWNFLERVLIRMGMDTGWVNRVMLCVTSVRFSVLINGSPTEEFCPQRGLRQGDPLSPYLFILCAEVLSSMMRRAAEIGSIHGVRVAPQSPTVTHLLFADDSIFFVKATINEAAKVKKILHEYAGASGQVINFDKTTVSFSRGTRERDKSGVTQVLGVRMVDGQDRYLGLPTMVGKLRSVVANVVRDKLGKKLQGWKGQLFSKAGREVLIKAVAQSIPTYAMSVFKLSDNFYNELRSLVSRFWWGAARGKAKIPWVAWSKMCKPKGMGGLGFRDFHKFNMALLGKQAWRFLTDKSSLMVRVLRGKYFPTGRFIEANLGDNPSYTWRGIWEAREVLKLGVRRRIGDGLTTKVWTDPWVPHTQSRMILSPRGEAPADMMVADLWSADGGSWDLAKVSELFLPFEQERILKIRISNTRPEDGWTWDLEKNGDYSVKSAYRALLGGEWEAVGSSNCIREKAMWNRIWKANVWPRVKVFMWQFCNEAIATKTNIATRIHSVDAGCPVCGCELETSLHLVRGCGWTGRVWDRLGLEVRRTEGYVRVREWVEDVWRELGDSEIDTFIFGCWAMWEARNKMVFENEKIEVSKVVKRVEGMRRELEVDMHNREGRVVAVGGGG